MNRLWLFLLTLTVSFCAVAKQYAVKDVPNVQLADSTRFVSNPDGILSEATVRAIDSEISRLRRATTAEVAVVVIDDIKDSDDIDRFATELFTDWGIGKSDRDNGVLVLLVKDQRAVTIRTGQGAEGVVTDLAAGRIIRNVMTPYFRDGDYDNGLAEGVRRISELISDPDTADELRSSQTDRHSQGGNDDYLWNMYLWLACLLGAGSLIVVGGAILKSRNEDDVTRYRSLERLRMPMLFIAFLSIGLGLPAWLWLRWKMRRIRLHARTCDSCGSDMRRLSEEEDNQYLTSVQDAEERLNSVDYDVWLCPKCGRKEVIPYVNRQTAYSECPKCHGRTRALLSDQVVKAPTPLSDGMGVRTYSCRHCAHRDTTQYNIPKVVVVPPVRRRGGGGGFGGFGGGFGGGGFGGGSTMGGGATGRW